MGTKTISGTREWSVESVNCVSGCSHNCLYCYARYNAVERFGRMKPEDWPRMRVRQHDVRKRRRKAEGVVMFPTTHDITPEVLEPCLAVLRNLLEAGNRVLVVSKPHLKCIRSICRKLAKYRSQILFRFTIGGYDTLREYWEPGAPSMEERLAALSHAHKADFATSVSCEPLLVMDAGWAECLFYEIEPYVTDTIWIGKMNHVRKRCHDVSEEAIAAVEAMQTRRRVREIYAALKHHYKVRWKESYKKVLGLEEAAVAGLDV